MLFYTVPTQTPIQPLRYTDSPVTTPTDTETPPLPTSLCSYHRSFQLDPAPLHTNVAPCSSTGLMQLGRISMVLAREKCDAGVSLISPFLRLQHIVVRFLDDTYIVLVVIVVRHVALSGVDDRVGGSGEGGWVGGY